MADRSHIEWTDATWNVITGCSVVSPGCTNCYAMKLAGTRLQHHPSRQGLTTMSKAGPVWNGQVRFNADWLDQPLRWTKPRMIFVCAHGDLFHEGVTDDQLDRIFAVMALTPQHTYQVLTKRSARMRAYLHGVKPDNSLRHGPGLAQTIQGHALEYLKHGRFSPNGFGPHYQTDYVNHAGRLRPLPLANVWLGVSAEDQARADERIPDLLSTPAAVRWVSAEPLLGPIDMISDLGGTQWIGGQRGCGGTHQGDGSPGCPRYPHHHHDARCKRGIDWVVAGGESGPGARPMHPDWARQLRDQCAAGDVPFFFKQWGAYLPGGQMMADGRLWSTEGGDVLHAAKTLSGRYLDGQLHDGTP